MRCRMSPLLQNAPRLGVGISCEFNGGTRALNLDALALREAWPTLIHFLEVGADTRRGLDAHMRRWAAQGLPTTCCPCSRRSCRAVAR